MQNRNSTKRRLASAALAGVFSLAGIMGFASSAHAADANIDPGEARSLTIHKFEQPVATGAATDGTVQDTIGLTPMDGVEFTISQVTAIGGTVLDLNNTQSWDLLAPYIDGTSTFDPAAATLAARPAQTTNAQGAATFSGLPLGAYWVTETDYGTHNVTNPMTPFLVTVPLPGTTAGDWIYEVHAYPKNSVMAASKTVDNSVALGLGSNVQWTVTGDIPLLGGNSLSSFVITDTLPLGMSHTSQTVTVNDAAGAAVAGFAAPADYEVVTVDQLSTLTFTTAGLLKLQANQGGSVHFGLATTVTDIGEGTLTNNAEVQINGSSVDVSANTTWGAVNILKHVAGAISNVLGGAEFQVFATEADATSLTDPIAVAGTTTFTTDSATGTVSIDGLYAATGGTSYWLVETKAPLGYLANAAPIEVSVTPGTVADGVQVAVANSQSSAPALPSLGGTGMVVAIVVGALAAVAGVSLWLSGSLRKKAMVS